MYITVEMYGFVHQLRFTHLLTNMTIKEILKGSGVSSSKTIFDRLQHGSAPNQGFYGPPHGPYNYPPPPPPPNYHGPPASHVFKHYSFSHSTGGGSSTSKGSGAALSALTLLSFLFFLNILQQCLKDQMMTMSPQVMIMTASREQLKREEVNGGSQNIEKRIIHAGSVEKVEPVENTKPKQQKEATIVKISTEEKDNENNKRVTALKQSPVFVFAMGDGVGEVYNEDAEF